MSTDGEQWAADIFDKIDAREARSKQIAADYTAGGRKVAKAAALVEYRCGRGCLLLHVWRAEDGATLYYQPAYKLSPARNEAESVPEARAKHTTDGERRWRARGGDLEETRGWGDRLGLMLQCDHVKVTLPCSEVLADADATTQGDPTRRTL